MSRRVDWTDQAIDDLKSLPDWQLAETVAKAVRRYGEEGVGFVLHVTVDDGPDEFRLLIPRERTFVLVRLGESCVYVEGIVYRK